ncbi:MAG: hypothetical protein ACE5J2_06005 [Nitrososphaerales archaeon]
MPLRTYILAIIISAPILLGIAVFLYFNNQNVLENEIEQQITAQPYSILTVRTLQYYETCEPCQKLPEEVADHLKSRGVDFTWRKIPGIHMPGAFRQFKVDLDEGKTLWLMDWIRFKQGDRYIAYVEYDSKEYSFRLEINDYTEP